jgi:uncharacterized protein (DUF2252 family)
MALDPAELAERHGRMRLEPFVFLGATFYRWCQLWRGGAGDLARAAPVMSVGDLQVENFGTWRDADGRLIWGINDLDEAAVLPWTQDLLRLAVSAHLAARDGHLDGGRRAACDAILEGYRDGITSEGRPFVLEEAHGWLRRAVTGKRREPGEFWRRMTALDTAEDVDPAAAAAIAEAMPARDLPTRIVRRVAGPGSRGRPCFVGIAEWRGGKVAREARALAPSAWSWASGRRAVMGMAHARAIPRAIRVPDPTLRLDGGWQLRRLAPHCTRVDLGDLPPKQDEGRLLYAMGFETANVHLGTPAAARVVQRELGARKSRWLHEGARAMTRQIVHEWNAWRATARL